MFKNCVFKASVSTKEWAKSALIRAARTMAQTAVSMITVGQGLLDIDWFEIFCVSVVAGIISILTSITGLPEVSENNERSE